LDNQKISSIIYRLELGRHDVVWTGLIDETIDALRELRSEVEDRDACIDQIDAALCNYVNNVGDEYTPIQEWDESIKRNFETLYEAYDTWHKDHKIVGKISRDEYVDRQRRITEECLNYLKHTMHRIMHGEDPKEYINRQIDRLTSELS
jgi:hypothetical protein